MPDMLIPAKATRGFTRASEFKILDILCGLVTRKSEVLEIGCGTGMFVSIPLGYLGIKILGIDSDPRSIEYAIRNNPHHNVSFICSSGEDFKTERKFDLIICNYVLEHLAHPLTMLQNISRLLKHDGTAFVCIPNGFGWHEIENFIPRLLAKTRFGKKLQEYVLNRKLRDSLNPDSPHVQFFTVSRFTQLAQQSNLRILKRINLEVADGPVTNRTLLKIPALAGWNVDNAGKVPSSTVASWIFLLGHVDGRV